MSTVIVARNVQSNLLELAGQLHTHNATPVKTKLLDSDKCSVGADNHDDCVHRCGMCSRIVCNKPECIAAHTRACTVRRVLTNHPEIHDLFSLEEFLRMIYAAIPEARPDVPLYTRLEQVQLALHILMQYIRKLYTRSS